LLPLGGIEVPISPACTGTIWRADSICRVGRHPNKCPIECVVNPQQPQTLPPWRDAVAVGRREHDLGNSTLPTAARTLTVAFVARMPEKRLSASLSGCAGRTTTATHTARIAAARPSTWPGVRTVRRAGAAKPAATLFALHRMPLRAYVMAVAIFCNEVKGKSMLALSSRSRDAIDGLRLGALNARSAGARGSSNRCRAERGKCWGISHIRA
jgi:hypothetical protein